MNDEVIDHDNDLLAMIMRCLGPGLYELLDEGTKACTVLVLFNAMHRLSGNIIDCTKAILLLVLTGRRHLALHPFQGSATHKARQEVQVNLVLCVHPHSSGAGTTRPMPFLLLWINSKHNSLLTSTPASCLLQILCPFRIIYLL